MSLEKVEKSKFYTFLIKINSLDDIDKEMNRIKLEYSDATHYCYAYILDNYKRCSDDGEPSGTAGMPILNVLEQKGLNHILCVVVRYFGGIKLGAGGLVRAYTKSVTNALEKVNIIVLEEYDKIMITFKYDYLKQINHILKDIDIIYKEYDELITYEFYVKSKDTDRLKQEIDSYINSFSQKEKVLK